LQFSEEVISNRNHF